MDTTNTINKSFDLNDISYLSKYQQNTNNKITSSGILDDKFISSTDLKNDFTNATQLITIPEYENDAMDFIALLFLLYEIISNSATERRETNQKMRSVEAKMQVSFLESAAEKLKSEANLRMVSTIVEGCVQIASSLVQIGAVGVGVKSLSSSGNPGKTPNPGDSKAPIVNIKTNVKNQANSVARIKPQQTEATNPIQSTKENIPANRKTRSKSQNENSTEGSDTIESQRKLADSHYQTQIDAIKAAANLITAFGKFATAALTHDADLIHADSKLDEAQATRADEARSQSADAVQADAEALRKLLDDWKAMLQAQHEAKMEIIRTI